MLTRLHRSHPGQEAMMVAFEHLWWPFMNRQIIETCEKCCECTLFGKNLKPATIFNTAQPLPSLSVPSQELQLDFAGLILDDKGSKIFLLVAIDRFSKFPSVLFSKNTGAKKVTKFLVSYIRIPGLPHSIRTDHGSGNKNNLVQEFCSSRGIKHILSPVGDHRGSGLVKRTILTIKRKLGFAKLDLNFKNFKETIQHILEDIRKSNYSVLKKSPFELHFGRKPNTVWSQEFNKDVQSDTSAQGLERNPITPDQIASQDYTRGRAKVVPRGSASPTVPPRFKPLFLLDGNVADSEPYKALAELARAANKGSQFKRNLPPDGGKRVLKEVATRHSDLAHSLKSGLNHNILRFSALVISLGTQVSPRRVPAVQLRRLSKTIAPNTLGDRLQASNSTSRGDVKRPVTRSQPVILGQRPNNPTLSTPMVDLTVDSSSESSVESNGGLHVIQDSSPVEKRQRLQCDSPPVTFAPQSNSISQLHTSTSARRAQLEESPTLPSEKVTGSSSSPRKPLIRDRLQPGSSVSMSPHIAHAKEATERLTICQV